MRNTVEKEINKPAIVITVILILLLGFVAVWAWLNYDAIKSTFDGTKLYTQDEVTEAYNQGITDRTSYEAQISDWIGKYEAEVSKNQTALNQISYLNGNLEDYRELTTEQQSIITGLRNRINSAEQDIEYYIKLLEQYQSLSQVVVAFIIDGNIYGDLVMVNKGSKLTELPDMQDVENIVFEGWSLDGETIINPLDVTINEDTRFIAVGQVKYTVTFIDDEGTTISSQKVASGQLATSPTDIEKAHYEFKYWAVEGDEVNLATYTINANTTFVAVYELLPITDLTNTTWIFNDELTNAGQVFNIDLLCNNIEYSRLYFTTFDNGDYRINIEKPLINGPTTIFNTNSGIGHWKNDAFKTIKVIGGRDATKTQFINWLQANATLVGFDD